MLVGICNQSWLADVYTLPARISNQGEYMIILSLQILLINFIVAGVITALLYLFNKNIRSFNPLLLFTISSLGSFLGTIFAVFIPNSSVFTEYEILKSIKMILPSIFLAITFVLFWIKGSKSKGYI